MKISYTLLVLVVIVCETYCGALGNFGKTIDGGEFEKENRDDSDCGLELEQSTNNMESSGNSPLLYDTNIHHPTDNGNSGNVKHKRCPSSNRLGISLQPRVDIVEAKAPQPVEKRDLQNRNKFYLKACTTCQERNRCNSLSDCPLCEKWCSKVETADGSEMNEVDTNNVVGEPQEAALPEQPTISLRSNFDDDEKRKNVYTITTLRSGAIKELFMRLLGVSNAEDVDTVVIWVTTHSNHPPLISRGFHNVIDPEVEKMAEAVKEELKLAIQEKFREHGEKFVTEGGDELDNIIRGILSKMHSSNKVPGLNTSTSSQIVGSRSNMPSEILPRYPIDSETLVVPQTQNPDIIEGPPGLRIQDEEGEQEFLEAKNDQDLTEREEQPSAGYLPDDESFPSDNKPRPFEASPDEKTIVTSDNDNVGASLKSMAMEENSPMKVIQTEKEAPGNKLREFINNVKANIVSAKNALPAQRNFLDGVIQNGRSTDLESSFTGMNALGRKHHDGERGHEIRGHLILPHNHRSNSQDDNIGSTIGESERLETGMMNPASESGAPRMPLLERMKTLNPTEMIERLKSRSSLNFQRPSEDMNHSETTDTQLGSELEESENNGARSHTKFPTHNQRPYKEHGKGHYPGHDKKHYPGHGEDHHKGHMPGHKKGHRGVWPTHRSSELENTKKNNSSQERPMGVNPGFENDMLGEFMNQTESGIEGSKNLSEESSTSNSERAFESQARENVIPIKFNVGARANELIQELKERQEMRKANLKSALQSSRSSLTDSAKPSEGVDATIENFGDQPNSITEEMREPVENPEVNNFENAEAALAKVRDLSKGLQEITVTNKPIQIEVDVTTPKLISDIEQQVVNTIEDESNKLIVEPDILKSQPLDDSFERIQPANSLFGRFSRRKNSDEQEKKKMVGDSYVGSVNPENVLEDQNQNNFTGFETVGDTNPAMMPRGQFETDQSDFSSSIGVIVPVENPTDAFFHQKPSDVYFLGNGIKLPLKMVKDSKGVMHLSVDLDKLCSCNNITCPKNHAVLEKAVETILENETDLKEKLEPMESVGTELRNGNYENISMRMALPQSMFEKDSSIQQEEMQSKMRSLEDETTLESSTEIGTPHRNERDTVEKEKFQSRNKITDSFDSIELQSDNTGILKRSPEVESIKISSNSLPVSNKPFEQPSRNFENKQKNGPFLLKKIHVDDESNNSKTTKTTPPSETTTRAVIIKTSSLEPNYFHDFMNKRLDDIRSKLNIRNEELKKDLTFPEYFFKNLWAAGKQQAEKILPNFNVDNTSSTLGSRFGGLLDKTVAANDEIYENLATINKPYKFKALENQLNTNLAHIGSTVDNYNKRDEEILKEEFAALDKINENPVVKKEVGIVSNILKFFKDLASDKNKKK